MASSASSSFARRFLIPSLRRFELMAALAGSGAFLGGTCLFRVFPALPFELFARGAAQLVAFFSGAPIFRNELGWSVPIAGAPVTVTLACSATDYFLIVASLIGFQAARARMNPLAAAIAGLVAAGPLTLLVNAVRIITVAHAHPWLISRLPTTYEAFLHMTVGAAVFLPSLIALNLLLETYGRHRCPAAA